jgi:peroxiredoxin
VFCRDHAVQLQRARERLKRAGEVVLIGQLTPRHAAQFRRRLEVTLPVLADEKRESYKAAGAKVATAGELVGPKVVAKGIQASRRSHVVQTRTIGHPAQLGGVMVVKPGNEIVYIHLADDAGDNPANDEVLAAVRDASKG